MGTKQKRAQQNRERVLEVAEQIVASKGVTGLTVRAVTAEAGLSVAMVAYYFGTATGLLEAVLDRHATALDQSRSRALGRLKAVNRQRYSASTFVRTFIRETLSYRWQGGTVAELLQTLNGRSETGLTLVRGKLLGLTGLAASQIQKELSALLPGISTQKLWWRWHIAMGGLAAAIELSSPTQENSGQIEDELTQVLVSLLETEKLEQENHDSIYAQHSDQDKIVNTSRARNRDSGKTITPSAFDSGANTNSAQGRRSLCNY